jgi:hypothetical protein
MIASAFPQSQGVVKMTPEDYVAAAKAQGVPMVHYASVCPFCSTVQSAHDLIKAGAGASFDEVEKYLHFSCVGRWTGAGPYTKETPSGIGCDYTLGGLFSFHAIEVALPNGQTARRFALATPEEAWANMTANVEKEGVAV